MSKFLVGWDEQSIVPDKKVNLCGQFFERISEYVESEITAMSAFLDNDGKLGKSMMVFADASTKYLPDFYSFLSEWGVAIGEGILYETDSNYHAAGDHTTLISANTGKNSLDVPAPWFAPIS